MEKIRVCTLCSGYDSQCMALDRLVEDGVLDGYDLVAWAEFDPESGLPLERQPAVMAHNALYPQWADRNLGDITKVDWTKVGDFDFLTYSTPCQSISNAGRMDGLSEGSGTRSSVLWSVRYAIMEKRPKWLLMENVKNLVSKRFMSDFRRWLSELEEMGYDNRWAVLDSCDFGVPQLRRRVFCVSVRRDLGVEYSFPEGFPLGRTVEDILEDDPDRQFFLNGKSIHAFLAHNAKYVKNDAE